MLLSSFLYVLFPLLSAFAVAWTFTIFERAKVELGVEHYAEKGDPSTFLKMPANASVNLGYVLVGIYWLWETRKLPKKLKDIAPPVAVSNSQQPLVEMPSVSPRARP